MTRAPRTGLCLAAASLAVTLGAAAPSFAQQPAPRRRPTPAPEATPAPAPEPKVQVGGCVDVYYGYNFNGSDPALRTFDVQHNAFSLSAAEVNFAKAPTADSRVGFRTDLCFGKAADLTAAFEPRERTARRSTSTSSRPTSACSPASVQFDAGKFVTPIGAEVIESQDNWNYTRSMLFGYAIPFYHTGVRATVTVSAEARPRRATW